MFSISLNVPERVHNKALAGNVSQTEKSGRLTGRSALPHSGHGLAPRRLTLVPFSEIDRLSTIDHRRRQQAAKVVSVVERAKRDCWSARLNKEGSQRWQNIPASVFAVRFEWKHLGNRKPWVIVIADHAVRGQVDRSMPSASGSQMQ
jgi:hypothetical protein